MTIKANKTLLREMFEEVWNEKRRDRIDDFYHGDLRSHGFGEEEGDLDTYKGWYDTISAAFPDITFELGEVFADESMAAATWRATGTHEGELMGIEPTGNNGTVSGISVARIDDGTITETWMNFDSLKMMQLVGAAPEPAPADD